MERLLAGIVVVPGIVSLLLFLVISYLYHQSRAAYFRAWQIGWGAYCVYYALISLNFHLRPSAPLYFISSLFLVAMAVCIFVSPRLVQGKFRLRWYDFVVCA